MSLPIEKSLSDELTREDETKASGIFSDYMSQTPQSGMITPDGGSYVSLSCMRENREPSRTAHRGL